MVILVCFSGTDITRLCIQGFTEIKAFFEFQYLSQFLAELSRWEMWCAFFLLHSPIVSFLPESHLVVLMFSLCRIAYNFSICYYIFTYVYET